jgi:hypothetical protein
VDRDAFIDRRHFQSNERLADYLMNMSESEYYNYRKSGERYLDSDKFGLFLSDNYVNTIIGVLMLKSVP